MSFPLTRPAELAAAATVVNPQMVLKIDGVDTLLGAVSILEIIQIGRPGLKIGDDWVIGGRLPIEDQESILQIEGSTASITQQLLQDKGGTGSVSSVRISAIDKDGFMTRLISPAVQSIDLMGRQALLYLGFQNTSYPEDYIEVFRGIIDDISSEAGKVVLNIAHPDQKKRQELFRQVKTELDGAIDDNDTTLGLVSSANLISPPADTSLKAYVRIDDEIIQFASIAGDQLTGCTRGALGTTAVAHDDEAEVTSFYRLEGRMIDLALKLMISGRDGPYASDVPVESFVSIGATGTHARGIFFKNLDVVAAYNVQVGDSLTVTGSASNNVTRLVQEIETTVDGSYVVVSGADLVDEPDSDGVIAFTSKYDTLGEGLRMLPNEVDIAEHLDLDSRFASVLPTYDFYIKDTLNGRDFIHEQLYFPAACYMLPRKGRASIGFTSPPMAIDTLKYLDSRNVIKPENLKIRRSTGKNFYNAVIYKYDEDPLEDRFRAGNIRVDEDSRNRIGITNPFVVEAKGLRKGAAANLLINLNSRRFLDRYKFAAESLEGVQIFFKDGFNVEAGDVVAFGDEGLKLSDTTRGDRQFDVRLMEVANKKLAVGDGSVTLSLIDTNYLADGRYGVVAPSSLVASSSDSTLFGTLTTSILLVSGAYGLQAVTRERDKWKDYVGEKVLVRSKDWASQEQATFLGFNPANGLEMVVERLSSPATADMIVDTPPYPDDADKSVAVKYKVVHAFLTPRVTITSGADDLNFDVGAGDIGKFFANAVVIVHTLDWSVVSAEVRVESVAGTTVTLADSLGFTPDNTYVVDLIGFPDQGAPYRLI